MGGKRRIFGVIAVVLVIIAGAIYYSTNQQRPARIELDFPKTITQGQEFTVPLRVSTSQAMNAAEFYFSFPAELLEVKSIDKTGTIYALWITGYPKFDNKIGEISFAGGLPTPGFAADNGLIATVTFKAKQSGSGTVAINQEKTQVLANDSFGTVIESTFQPVAVQIDD
ncbi:MAG: cohesin domain-containing protein [Patescibacteria group bacterium]